MSEERARWFTFDPTIHAGHVMTALTIIVCAVGSWYSVQSDIGQLKSADAAQIIRIDKVELRVEATRQETDRKIEKLVADQSQALGKLRDDMNGWFMTLNDKLDRKADKR